jgi:probable HAF family extracellular repeat protein
LQVASHQSLDEISGTPNMKRNLLLTTIAACLAAASLAQAASFTGLGLLSGYPNTWGFSVSADGSVVAGWAAGGTPANRAFRWRQTDGFTPIYGPYPPSGNQAWGVSPDGVTVLGSDRGAAFRWTQSGGMSDLGQSGWGSWALAASTNASVIVGNEATSSYNQAFRWTNGVMALLGYLSGDNDSCANAVSADGSVVVGYSRNPSTKAFCWTQSGGMTNLGYLPGGYDANAYAISADGTVFVGMSSSSSSAYQAFRWQGGAMTGLGFLPGDNFSWAYGVSADGSVVVGTSATGTARRPFIWDGLHGMRDLWFVLTNDFGLDLSGWTGLAEDPGYGLKPLMGLSPDGTWIAGTGMHYGHREAWLAHLDFAWATNSSGKWENPTNWSLGFVPTPYNTVLVANPGTKTVTIDADTVYAAPASLTINKLLLSAPGTDQLTLQLNNSGIASPLHVLNSCSVLSNATVVVSNAALQVDGSSLIDGTLNLAAGSVTANSNFLVAISAMATGVVSVTGGTLSVSNGVIGVGNAGDINSGSGSGFMLISNSTVSASALLLGSTAGGSGELIIERDGILDVEAALNNDAEIRAGGLLQVHSNSNGLASLDPNLRGRLVAGYQRDGAVEVTGGTVIAPEIVIGLTNGTGKLNLASGSVTANSNFLVGVSGSATGLVSVTGGTLSVTNGILGVGNAGNINSGSGTGSMLVSNATVTAASLMLGSATGGSGDMTIDNGGTVTVLGGLALNDAEVKTNGLLEVLFNPAGFAFEDPNLHNRIVAGYQRDAAIKVTGGTVIAPEMVIGLTNGTGTFSLTNGSVTVSNLLVGLNSSGTGVVNVAGGTLTATNGLVRVGPAGNGHFNISGGKSIVTDLKLGGSTNGAEGVLQLTGGHLTVLSNLSANFIIVGCGDLDGSGGTVIIGEDHDGSMEITCGAATNITTLLVGYTPGYSGTLTQSGGLVSVQGNVIVGQVVGAGAPGTMTLSGGNCYVTNAAHAAVLDVRNGAVCLNNGATLSVDILMVTSASGHFVKGGGLLTASNTVLSPSLDADDDGLPNGWEQAHSLDPLSASGDDGALGDPDHDGQNNLAEYQAGTNPTNTASVFRLLGATVTGQDVQVTWTTVGGHSYVVQVCTDATGGVGAGFVDCSGVINVGGEGEGARSYTHIGGATNRGAYYRVRLGP